MPQKSEGCGGSKQEGQGGMCPHCNKPKPPPELLAQILSLQNNRTAQMMQGMDGNQPYMMGGSNPMFGGMTPGSNFNSMQQTTPSTNQASNNRSSGYEQPSNQYNMGSSNQNASKNNEQDNNPYGMMNRNSSMGAAGGQGFDMSQFSGGMGANPMMGGMGFGGGFPMNMQDMQRMGSYGYGMGMGGNSGQMSHGQQESNQNQQDNNRSQNMMDMNQMSGMGGGYNFGQGGNPMMNFQNMTPEQQQQYQLMQYQRMQGGMPGNMNQGGNQG